MKKILLTQDKFTLVDDCDYAYLMQWKWCYNQGYAVRTDRTKGAQTILMHRVILERKGFKNFAQTDHRNQNKLDNRRGNLRPATASQNKCNNSKYKNNTSGHKGAHWHKRKEKWLAQIRVNGKQIHLGCYDNLKEATRAYNEAAHKCHGEFAVLNEV